MGHLSGGAPVHSRMLEQPVGVCKVGSARRGVSRFEPVSLCPTRYGGPSYYVNEGNSNRLEGIKCKSRGLLEGLADAMTPSLSSMVEFLPVDT